MEHVQLIPRAECLHLLGGSSLGRVAFSDRALPAIRAVTYTLLGTSLVLSVGPDGLGRQLDGQVVAFEVDEMDALRGSGWSVVVTGTARLMRRAGELMRDARVPLVSMAVEGDHALVCIVPGQINGRRMEAARTPA